MREYETIFILDPNLGENEVQEEVEKVRGLITGMDGEIVNVEPSSKRKLAYEIQGKTEGIYTLIKFRTKPANIGEIERVYRLNERVLRHIVVSCSERGKGTDSPEEQEAVGQ
jgi:small subunit ribosomal protein S6